MSAAGPVGRQLKLTRPGEKLLVPGVYDGKLVTILST
jgi:hypothetical protein